VSRFGVNRSSVWDSRPEGQASTTPAGLDVLVEHAERHELLERGFDTLAAEMTMEESPYLFSGQSVLGGVEGVLYAISGGVAGGGAEEERGTGRAVIPCGQSSLEMGLADDGSAVESSVDGAEAQDLGFGAAGGSAVETGTDLAQFVACIGCTISGWNQSCRPAE
jgi:hypothetical protein